MIRKAQKKDVVQLSALWKAAFAEDSVEYIDYYMQNRFLPSRCFVLEIENEIVAAVHLPRYTIYLRGMPIPTTYIVGLATLPAHRNKGYAAALMEKALQFMMENKEPISHLYPFLHSFYLAYGYETVSDVNRWTIQKEDLLQNPAAVLPEHDDKMSMLEMYQMFVQPYNGYVVREDMQQRIDEICVDGAKIQVENAYALYYEDDKNVEIEELVYQDESALKALCHALFSKGKEKITAAVPFNKTIEDFATVKKEEYIMMRVTDLSSVLLQTPAEDGFSVTIEVEDALLENNNGVFIAKANDGIVRFEKACTALPEYKLDILQLARWIAGAALEIEEKEKLIHLLPEQNNFVFERF